MLFNCPLVDQLNEPTMDGGPDESAQSNCVPAALASLLMGYFPDATYDGDEIRDAVYGEGSSGGTDPVRYIPYLAEHGVALTQMQSTDGNTLVHAIIACLQGHNAATGAIPSMWATAPADPLNPTGGTHEVLWCDYDPVAGMLTAMNPWPEPPTNNAFFQTQPLAWWAARIVYGRVFTAERNGPMIPTGWTDDGTTLTAPNHVTVVQGFRDYILAHAWDDFNWPLDEEYGANPVDPEAPQVGGGTRQDFREGSLGWTPALGVTRVWVGDELLALRAEVAKLTANPPAGTGTEPDADDAALTAANAQVTQLSADKAQLQQEVAALQAQLANAHATLSQEAADAIAAIGAIKTALGDPVAPAPPTPATAG